MTNLVEFKGTETINGALVIGKRTVGSMGRLMTAREYKEKHGVKGNAAKKSYAEYVLKEGAISTATLAGEMASGNLLVKSFKAYDKAGTTTVTFIKKSAVQANLDKASKPAVAAPPTVDEAEAALAKAYGVTVEVLRSLKAVTA